LYHQSERLPIYDEHCERLIRDGRAYRCFCSPEDLQAQRVGDYDEQPPNPCIHISPEESAERASKGEKFAVIFKPDDKPAMFQDFVYGAFRSRLAESEFFIRKRDGFPTYHFANVVDDHLMEITHVIRGAEWLISTPKHLQLYKALGWEPPAFGHVGLLVDEKKHKLSKRAPGVDLSWYKNEKILPAALLNFAILLGWSPNSKNEVMTLQEMVQKVG
jgi:glutamyl-tRNA synthetase